MNIQPVAHNGAHYVASICIKVTKPFKECEENEDKVTAVSMSKWDNLYTVDIFTI